MRKLLVLALLGLSGCGGDAAAVRECSEAITDIGNVPNVEAKCDRLPEEKQREAAEIASKKNGLIIYLPPYEAKKARQQSAPH